MKRISIALAILFAVHISAFAEMSSRQGGGMMSGGGWWGMNYGWYYLIIIAILIISGIYLILKQS